MVAKVYGVNENTISSFKDEIWTGKIPSTYADIRFMISLHAAVWNLDCRFQTSKYGI